MSDEINIEKLFKNLSLEDEKENEKEKKIDPIEILSLRDETLDLYTAIDRKTLTNLVKNRLIMDIFFEPEGGQKKIMENFDENVRALSVSLERKGREDVKDIHSVNILSNLIQEEKTIEGEVSPSSFSKFKRRLGFK
ncbi:MAG: hypothetical protein SVO01_05055 [Thermotogota bacterium]|nr:hypothetical protein [Thermotogota bacterium]